MDRVKYNCGIVLDENKIIGEILDVFKDTFGDDCISLTKNFYFYKITVGRKFKEDTSILIRDGVIRIMYIRLPEEFQKLGLATRLFKVLDKQHRNSVSGLYVDTVINPNLRRLLEKHSYTPCNYNGFDKDMCKELWYGQSKM